MSKIDIIIPVYNQAGFIGACLKSIFQQTFQDFTVVVVNDGSTDNIKSALEPYLSRIKLIDQDNKGANAARNRGFGLLNSPYVIFCDADVVMKPTMLKKMYFVLESTITTSYVYSSFKFGFKTFRLWDFDEEKLKQMPYIHTTSLLRRKHFPRFDEKLSRLQDWDLWLTMVEGGHIGKWIPEILFQVKSGGTMSQWFPKSFYQLFPWSKKVQAYNEAVRIIKEKHGL